MKLLSMVFALGLASQFGWAMAEDPLGCGRDIALKTSFMAEPEDRNLPATPPLLSTEHRTSCHFCRAGGVATGYFYNFSQRKMAITGDVWMYFYDTDKKFCASASEFVEALVEPDRAILVGRFKIPKSAKRCRFEVDEESIGYRQN